MSTRLRSKPKSSSSSFTSHLLSLHPTPLRLATQHPFLTHAGAGTLPDHTLSTWLSQDRLYAQSYIPFIGGLLSCIRLPQTYHVPFSLESSSASIQWRIADLLIGALENIKRELRFFEYVAGRYALHLEKPGDSSEGVAARFGPTKVTQEYIDLFLSFTNPEGNNIRNSLLEGLVVLWGTEKCYLLAWQYAKSQQNSGRVGKKDLDGGALRKEFIPNWTSTEFEEFVEEIAEVVDEFGRGASEEEVKACEAIWEKVLKIEEGFWPQVD